MSTDLPPTTDDDYGRQSSSSATASPGYTSDGRCSPDGSPYTMSPWHQSDHTSPWSYTSDDGTAAATALIGSLVREEGHIYSLAASGELLYTGSDSKNIHVWKNQKEFSGFKSSSGLVKSIVVSDHRIFTGHQDGKIRVWKVSPKNPAVHKRVGSLPRLKDILKSSLKPSNYVEVRRHKTALWIKHADAISCLSLGSQGLLYSGSWDKTFKVWRIADSRCLESVVAHDDAVNSIAAATFDGLIYTGSADGTVKVWRREMMGKITKHHPVQTLIKHDCAVTALAVSTAAPIIYAGSSDGIVNFWEGERQLAHGGVLRGHKMAVLCLAAAGSLLLSGSADKTIFVWRRESRGHTCLSVLTGHGGPVKCLAVEVDRSCCEGGGAAAARWIVYSGSLDKSVKVWRVSDQTPDALLHGPQQVQVGTDEYGGAQQVGQDFDGPRSVRAAA